MSSWTNIQETNLVMHEKLCTEIAMQSTRVEGLTGWFWCASLHPKTDWATMAIANAHGPDVCKIHTRLIIGFRPMMERNGRKVHVFIKKNFMTQGTFS